MTLMAFIYIYQEKNYYYYWIETVVTFALLGEGLVSNLVMRLRIELINYSVGYRSCETFGTRSKLW